VASPPVLFGDGDPAIGAGHHIRLAAIADALAALGEEPVLACRDLPGSTHAWAWRGRAVRLLPAAMPADEAAAGALLIDHYGVRSAPGSAALSDGPGFGPPAGASLAVLPRPGAHPGELPDLPCAAGAAWVPLRAAFAQRRGATAGGPVLVACGATDPGGTGARIAADLAARGHAVARLPGGADADAVAALIAGCSRAVVSASTLALECLAVGVPVVAVRTAANQERLAAGLAGLGVPVVAPEQAADALAMAAAPPFDAGGAARIAERLRELRRAPAAGCLRAARWSDADDLLAWANDPTARAASFDPRPIARDGHLAWFARLLGDPEARCWIGDGAGTVRLARSGRAATVSIAVAPAGRGRGLARRMLADLAAWNAATGFAARIDAWVRDGNDTSHRLFAGAGWRLAERGAVAGSPATRYAWGTEEAP
jgi:GNAT superfamily N-acetyltransferase